jgi:hypothetical protein
LGAAEKTLVSLREQKGNSDGRPGPVSIARAIKSVPGLGFDGIQAYQSAAQHLEAFGERTAYLDSAIALVKKAVAALEAEDQQQAASGAGHCDPTVNSQDWFGGLRGGKVECLWPVSS